MLNQIKQSVKNMSCPVLAFSGDFQSHLNSLKKKRHSDNSQLVPCTFRGTHSIAACYLHFAPEENPEYLSHFGVLLRVKMGNMNGFIVDCSSNLPCFHIINQSENALQSSQSDFSDWSALTDYQERIFCKTEYLSHFGKGDHCCSRVDKHPKQTLCLLILLLL